MSTTRVPPPAPDRHRRRHPFRRASVAALATVGLLALGGCMKVDWDMTLHEDDTASGTVVMGFSDEVAESMGMDPQELWDSFTESDDSLTEGLPEGSTEEPYADGEYTGVQVTFTDQPISEMGGTGGEELSVTREGDEFVVDGVFDLSQDAQDMEDMGQMPEGLLDSFDMRISITFPGEVTETTGEVDGTTVVWTPTFGERTEIHARASAVGGGAAAPDEEATEESTEGSDDGAGSTTGDDVTGTAQEDDAGFPWWVVGLVLGLAVLGTVVALIVRNNRRPGPPGAGAPGTGPAPYTAGGVPPGYGQPQQQAPPVVPPQQTAQPPYPPPYQGPQQPPPAGPQQPPAGPQQPPHDPDGTPPAAPR